MTKRSGGGDSLRQRLDLLIRTCPPGVAPPVEVPREIVSVARSLATALHGKPRRWAQVLEEARLRCPPIAAPPRSKVRTEAAAAVASTAASGRSLLKRNYGKSYAEEPSTFTTTDWVDLGQSELPCPDCGNPLVLLTRVGQRRDVDSAVFCGPCDWLGTIRSFTTEGARALRLARDEALRRVGIGAPPSRRTTGLRGGKFYTVGWRAGQPVPRPAPVERRRGRSVWVVASAGLPGLGKKR